MTRNARAAVTAAGALGLAALGAGAGAGIYAAVAPTSTTTVVQAATTVDHSQPAAASSGLSINALYQKTNEGVVDITVQTSSGLSPFGGSQSSSAEGSGFVYDARGNIITNEHVIDGATAIHVKFWNGQTFTAKLVGKDVATDLAVVHVAAPASLLHPLTLGDSNAVQVGDSVIAIGSPFGLAGTVTSGIVSALDRTMQSPTGVTIGGAIQTDAPINHGNSGGPLIDAFARVIGVNAQIQSDSGGNDGVGFAIPSNTVKSVASQLVAGKAVKHAYLGIQVNDSTSPAGALVAQTIAGGAAARAGLQSGDVIVTMDGKPIASADDLSSVIDTHQPGDTISVTYVRGGKKHTVDVKLGTRPS